MFSPVSSSTRPARIARALSGALATAVEFATLGEVRPQLPTGGQRSRSAGLPHPHRRRARAQITRRPGVVPARPAHCTSPVRHSAPGAAAAHEHARR
jgi:hypothetical protein